MMRTNMIEAVMGAIVLIIAVFFLVFAYTSSQGGNTAGYTLTANFDRIDGLVVGNDIRIGGVKVGSVISIEVDSETYLAHVVLTVRKSLKLPIDTAAEISSESLMGGKYLALVPGGDEKMLEPGDTITYTQSAISFENLLGKYLFSGKDSDKKTEEKEEKQKKAA